MTPLAEFPLEARRAIRGVLADIDDTLPTHGRVGVEEPDVVLCLARLADRIRIGNVDLRIAADDKRFRRCVPYKSVVLVGSCWAPRGEPGSLMNLH